MAKKACELKSGSLIGFKDVPYVLETVRVTMPSARGAASIYHFRFRNLVDKTKKDVDCHGDDVFTAIDFEKRAVQYLFRDGDQYTFMDTETFEQFTLSESAILEQLQYLVEDMEGIYALLSEGRVLTIELPQKVTLTIAECDPVLKGASATARSKPAKCHTGLTVLVPEYLEAGEEILVDTTTGEFAGRANVAKF